jgi:hypothetical protein|tara:strand:- start:1037 stop:1633 length:597 start_codon:yes stop_codon:yes gene_type:complete
MIILASLLTSLAFAGTIDVYVSPIAFVNRASNETITISHELDAPLYYSSMYARSAKMKNGHGGYEVVEKARVYGKDTIKHSHPDCNYRREPLGCSIKNEHYYVETIATYNNDQMIFRSVLYGPEGTIVSTASRTGEMIVNWIKQQEITIVESEGRGGKQTMTHYGKEELPLKWEIPYKLLQHDVQQTIKGLWTGIKLD